MDRPCLPAASVRQAVRLAHDVRAVRALFGAEGTRPDGGVGGRRRDAAMSDGGMKGNGETVVPNGPGQPVKDPQPKLFGEEQAGDEYKTKMIRGVYRFGEVASA